MKKISTTILLIAISIGITQAQGLYLGVNGGYGFSAGKSSYQTSSETDGLSGSTITYTSKHYSLGKGINTGMYVGYMFTKNIGAEVAASYLMGYKFDMNSTVNDQINQSTSTNDETIKGSMIRVIPALKIMIGEKKFHPYVKAGLVIGMGNKLIDDVNLTGTGVPPNSTSESIQEFKGGISIGFHGAAGINFMFTDRIGIFAEASGICQNWAPKKSTLTKSTSNGVDQLPTMTTYQKETDYVNSYTTTSGNVDESQPQKSNKFYLPFSSIGFNIGLHISFGKKAEKG